MSECKTCGDKIPEDNPEWMTEIDLCEKCFNESAYW
jgi:hypothetical protein